MKRALTALRYVAGAVLLVSAWGWLEILRSIPVPGPRLGASLPLHEGARASALPLGTVAGVWFGLGLLTSLLFRPRRHIAAAVLFALTAFATATVSQGVQLEITRQGLFGVDTIGALTTPGPWVAAVACLLVSLVVWTPVGALGSTTVRTNPAGRPKAGRAEREPLAEGDRQTFGVASGTGAWTP